MPPQKLWKQPKRIKLDKGVQVFEDERDILVKKYNWKNKQFSSKMIQTDDIRLEVLAQEQRQYLLNLP